MSVRRFGPVRGTTTADRASAQHCHALALASLDDVETYGAPRLPRETRAFAQTMMAIVVAVLVACGLGIAGSGDYRSACEDIAAAGASDSADALQCAQDFPSLFPQATR